MGSETKVAAGMKDKEEQTPTDDKEEPESKGKTSDKSPSPKDEEDINDSADLKAQKSEGEEKDKENDKENETVQPSDTYWNKYADKLGIDAQGERHQRKGKDRHGHSNRDRKRRHEEESPNHEQRHEDSRHREKRRYRESPRRDRRNDQGSSHRERRRDRDATENKGAEEEQRQSHRQRDRDSSHRDRKNRERERRENDKHRSEKEQDPPEHVRNNRDHSGRDNKGRHRRDEPDAMSRKRREDEDRAYGNTTKEKSDSGRGIVNYGDLEREESEEVRTRDRQKRRQGESSDDAPSKKSRADDPKSQEAKKTDDPIMTRTGGAYIPPARLRMMQAQIADKSSEAFQRLAWEALKKSIHGLINKVNASNIAVIVREIFKENIVRGRGLLCRDLMQAQSFSPTFTPVYASLVSIINTKFPNIVELLIRRLIIQFRRSFKRNDKNGCLSSTRFIAHLVNHQICHEILALEILTLLLESPTEDAVEVAIGLLRECGMKLTEVSPRGIAAIFDRLRSVLHESQLDKRVQYMIEVMFQVRKEGFKDHPAIPEELDLVEEDDQFTHTILLDDATNGEEILNVFKVDPEYQENEEKYKSLRHEILDEDDEGSGEDEGGTSGDESDDEDESDSEEKQTIVDNTETNLVALRRTIYLTIQSSLDFEEAAHKLTRLELKPGQEVEMCHMILDCCAQQRTYEKFFGLLAQRFCQINKIYVDPFERIFHDAYDTCHRFDTNKLRNVSRFFAHLLFTDAIQWMVLCNIRLNEEDTTSSSRIFIKLLFQELAEYMGLGKLNERIKDPTLQPAFEGLFPRDNPQNTRFAINFFTSIGLGGLTDDLREHLAKRPKPTAVVKAGTETEGKQRRSDGDAFWLIKLQHVQQRLHWDCGLACVAMVLPDDKRDQFLANLPAICHEEGFGESTWSIDLAYLLSRVSVPHVYCTITFGVNPGHSREAFYDRIIGKDRHRVTMRFEQAAARGVKVEQREVSLEEILSHLRYRGPVILLTDANRLLCTRCTYNRISLDAAACCPFRCPYQGHYIVACGYSLTQQRVFYRNPSLGDRVCCMPFETLEDARSAYGTDEDVIFVTRDTCLTTAL
ncbi:unnamed protein product [Darwinula stevensoni]|uniref:MI domain-containing protein n=1 Tax=Darwinula stevensoni TaxID=69355 RepID=A0A7R8X655_9CRUS|nr:unnamed protein product [Darwinula stevensoni]CAG0887789.1 unnamed protein product [Darwinula stevensoni]